MGIATNIVKFRDMAPEKARAYVLTAAKNASINLYNQESKIRETVINLEDMDFVPAADLFAQIEQEDLFTFLLTVIENLPQTHRDVLILHYVHNMNCAEIAITLGKSHAATRQMLAQAHKALQVMCKKVCASLED
jgi:RNA polymerase sigma factor (sigma-70 family)